MPVERILEDVLDLSILWDDISEPPSQSILAALDPGSKTVVFNESRRTLITDTPGLYYTVLAHEAGHWEVHVDHGHIGQQPLPSLDGNSAASIGVPGRVRTFGRSRPTGSWGSS